MEEKGKKVFFTKVGFVPKNPNLDHTKPAIDEFIITHKLDFKSIIKLFLRLCLAMDEYRKQNPINKHCDFHYLGINMNGKEPNMDNKEPNLVVYRNRRNQNNHCMIGSDHPLLVADRSFDAQSLPHVQDPEELRNLKEKTYSWALGAVLYALLTRRWPKQMIPEYVIKIAKDHKEYCYCSFCCYCQVKFHEEDKKLPLPILKLLRILMSGRHIDRLCYTKLCQIAMEILSTIDDVGIESAVFDFIDTLPLNIEDNEDILSIYIEPSSVELTSVEPSSVELTSVELTSVENSKKCIIS